MAPPTPTSAPRPAPRQAPRSRSQRLLAPTLVAGGLGLASLALRLRDPHAAGSWGACPSAALGWWCPGCGGLRAVNDLTHLQVGDAASSNLALVVGVPIFTAWFVWWLVRRWRGEPRAVPTTTWLPLLVTAVALVGVFTVLRNTGAGAWLAP